MSSKDLGQTEIDLFVSRLVEACGSDQPGKIAQLLNVTYQAARNYLDGRLPEAKVLRSIAEKTPYSINWLLTGDGEKFVRKSRNSGIDPAFEEMRAFVRQTCVDVFAELNDSEVHSQAPKIIKLTADKIKEETFRVAAPALSEIES